jgi:hypothetical protein
VAGVGDLGDAASSRDVAGPYFSLVSVLPSALLVFHVFLLFASGGWSGRPDFHRAASTILHLGLTGVLLLVVASFSVALVIHPLQFALVQLLEGYGGASRLVEHARGFRMKHHWQRINKLTDRKHSRCRLGGWSGVGRWGCCFGVMCWPVGVSC